MCFQRNLLLATENVHAHMFVIESTQSPRTKITWVACSVMHAGFVHLIGVIDDDVIGQNRANAGIGFQINEFLMSLSLESQALNLFSWSNFVQNIVWLPVLWSKTGRWPN